MPNENTSILFRDQLPTTNGRTIIVSGTATGTFYSGPCTIVRIHVVNPAAGSTFTIRDGTIDTDPVAFPTTSGVTFGSLSTGIPITTGVRVVVAGGTPGIALEIVA